MCLLASPLGAGAATWSTRELGCHGSAAKQNESGARKIDCHGSGSVAKQRKIGCHGKAASGTQGKGCCCRKFGAISSERCGCRHDAPQVMTRDSAVPPPLMMLRTVEAYVPLDPWLPRTPRGIHPSPPDPPPRHRHARTFTN